MLLCRDLEKADAAKEEIAKETGGAVETMKLDLSSLRSIRECAEKILEKEDKIHILVNNAGVMVSLNFLLQLSLLQRFPLHIFNFRFAPTGRRRTASTCSSAPTTSATSSSPSSSFRWSRTPRRTTSGPGSNNCIDMNNSCFCIFYYLVKTKHLLGH